MDGAGDAAAGIFGTAVAMAVDEDAAVPVAVPEHGVEAVLAAVGEGGAPACVAGDGAVADDLVDGDLGEGHGVASARCI